MTFPGGWISFVSSSPTPLSDQMKKLVSAFYSIDGDSKDVLDPEPGILVREKRGTLKKVPRELAAAMLLVRVWLTASREKYSFQE